MKRNNKTTYQMCKLFKSSGWLIYAFVFFMFSMKVSAQYVELKHKPITEGVVPVSKPGSYAVPGTTYMLVNDISSPMSGIFLGKDVTLDLNGYSLTFANANYEHIPNFGFEDSLKNWDISKAPSARIEDTKVHVFIGDKILRLSKGEEIVSQYINLPIPNRSYIAMCGVATLRMKVSVFVEDELGNSIVCNSSYLDGIKQSCPIENRSPRLGGGFVFAHLNGLKAGKYRIRIKANTDCLIDHIDIRPAMDVGIGIVEETVAMGHNDHLYEGEATAFFDYTADALLSKPISDIPDVKGKGTITIKNGIIKNGTLGAISWGIQSTAKDVMVVLDNVKIINSGINATAADLLQANITKCSFEVRNPFIINRHGSAFYAVDLRGNLPSEVSYSEFYGGQGCLAFKGNFSNIHNNFFANRQTVTNHYSIMAMGDSSLIFENILKPEIGSGIEIFRHKGIEIFNNEIHVKAAPPTSEYGHEEFSTTAFRIADYGAEPGSPEGCFGNKIYNNMIFVTGKDYPEYPDYIPMTWAIFYSASGGENYFFGNKIEVTDSSLGAKNETSALYIGGGAIGGHFYDNQITSNVPVAWVASRYGAATDTEISNNIIVKSNDAEDNFVLFRMGWEGYQKCIASNIQFRSNVIIGTEFGVNATNQDHNYSVFWTLNVKVVDENGNPVSGEDVKITNKMGEQLTNMKTMEDGSISCELMEYSFSNFQKSYSSPYTIIVGKKTEIIWLDKNKEIILMK